MNRCLGCRSKGSEWCENCDLGKAVIMARASELLAEVEDFFLHTPMCPKCRIHKMELQIGEPLVAGCTGGCEL
jgi:Zn finger protein HypA/HybF involved in hydrogenase expression